jgi:hypothetical protein
METAEGNLQTNKVANSTLNKCAYVPVGLPDNSNNVPYEIEPQ